MRIFFSLLFLLIILLPLAKAQDTLPGFTTSLKSNGKVLISWRNAYPSVKQISIQRSLDSLRNFTTFLTVPDPSVDENGFVDSKAGSSKMYYRIFILFPNSKYTFTQSRRAYVDPVDQPLAAASQKTTRDRIKRSEPSVKPDISPNTNDPRPVGSDKTTSTQASPSVLPVGNAALAPALLGDAPPAASGSKPKETAIKTVKPAVSPEKQPVKKDSQAASAEKSNIVQADIQSPVLVKPAVAAEEKYLIFPKIDNARIFYMMDNSNARKPSVTSPNKIRTPTIIIEKILFVKRRDSVIMQLSANKVRRFSDSLVKQTKDTLLFVNADTLQINPFIEIYRAPREIYKASLFVFTSRDGNINIFLKDAAQKNYHVAFFETDDTPLMEVNDIKDGELIIDKANFGHSGWFKYELYEDGKLKEKNRLLIPRD